MLTPFNGRLQWTQFWKRAITQKTVTSDLILEYNTYYKARYEQDLVDKGAATNDVVNCDKSHSSMDSLLSHLNDPDKVQKAPGTACESFESELQRWWS